MEPIRLILTDDHTIVREGLRQLLAKSSAIEIVDEASNGDELIEKLEHTFADVVFLDLSMPIRGGIETIPILKQRFPRIKIIILSMHEEPEYILKCVHAGAHGYLMKSATFNELVAAIQQVHKGIKYFPEKVSSIVMANLEQLQDHNQNAITPREQEVLKEVASGLSNKQIADKLFISHRTVETHRMNLLKKLEAANTADLIRKAADLKLL